MSYWRIAKEQWKDLWAARHLWLPPTLTATILILIIFLLSKFWG